jgi:hypothetical protein
MDQVFSSPDLENSIGYAIWQAPEDILEPLPDPADSSAGVEVLRQVIGEVFRNRNGKLDASAAFNKFLALVWVMRPDMLDGKSLTTLGDEVGCTRACLSKLAVQWSDMLDGYRNGGMKSRSARQSYREVQKGHENFRVRASNGHTAKIEARLSGLLADFKAGEIWKRTDREFLRRRGLIGGGDRLTEKGREWVEGAPSRGNP